MGGGLNEFRQLIEYPVFTDDNRKKFHGTLKQYRKWEAEEIAKTRAVMQSLEAKGKKDTKKDAKKEEGKKEKSKKEEKASKKKDKNKNRASAMPEATQAEAVEAVPDPTFVDNLTFTPFDHLLQ